MATNNPRGFVEYRNLAGRVSPITRTRRVKADRNPHQIYVGDPVALVSGNSVVRIPSLQTTASLPVLGVVRAIFNSNGRPLTHNLPTTGHYLPISTAGYVSVNEDPDQTYLVNADSTVVSTHIGQYVEITAATPNTAAGISGISIKLSNASNTATANALPFRIIELGANNLEGAAIAGNVAAGVGVGGIANQDVEVQIINHTWRNTNKTR